MNYDVVLNANDSTTLETQYAFTQGDYGQIQFSIRVKADGQYVTNAQRAYIVFSLSNGMIVTGADMPKSVATYTYVFQGNELQSPGKVVADVKLVYANGQISSNKFTFMCRFDPLADKSVPAAPYITALQQIVDEGQEKIDYLQALIDAMQGSIGSTALTRNDLQNTRNPISAGAKAIDAQMAQYLLLKSDLVNNALATTPGVAPLDSAMGKTFQDQITSATSNLNNKADLKYQIIDLNSADLITLPLGRWAVNNGLAGGESGGWFAEVVQYDDAFVSLLAIPYDGTKKYFYRAKKTYGVWRGWEKYTSAI
ncbi:MAG: BppU family phage baseplate upper protein [Lacrimispora sphenoides]